MVSKLRKRNIFKMIVKNIPIINWTEALKSFAEIGNAIDKIGTPSENRDLWRRNKHDRKDDRRKIKNRKLDFKTSKETVIDGLKFIKKQLEKNGYSDAEKKMYKAKELEILSKLADKIFENI